VENVPIEKVSVGSGSTVTNVLTHVCVCAARDSNLLSEDNNLPPSYLHLFAGCPGLVSLQSILVVFLSGVVLCVQASQVDNDRSSGSCFNATDGVCLLAVNEYHRRHSRVPARQSAGGVQLCCKLSLLVSNDRSVSEQPAYQPEAIIESSRCCFPYRLTDALPYLLA